MNISSPFQRWLLSGLCLSFFVSLSAKSGVVTAKSSAVSSAGKQSIETFAINLDLPPEERWIEVATKYKEPALKIVDWILDQVFDKDVELIEASFDIIEHYWPRTLQLREEIEGISKVLGVSPGMILFLNLFYDTVNSCTSVVAQDASGTMWHGRNLDFDIPNLQDIEAHLHFMKNGQVAYEATTYAMYIGVPTGMKAGAFSLSQDQRYRGDPIWENLLEWMIEGGQSYSFLLRDILENTETYGEALHQLETTPLISPSYFIIAGTEAGQGAVVSRERNKAADTWILSETDDWFLVQTNDDHWLPPLDERREATNAHMKQYSPQTMNAVTMLKVMTQYPTLNELTTYTSVISAQRNYFYSIKQNDENHTTLVTIEAA